jgi:hypothetical protein
MLERISPPPTPPANLPVPPRISEARRRVDISGEASDYSDRLALFSSDIEDIIEEKAFGKKNTSSATDNINFAPRFRDSRELNW